MQDTIIFSRIALNSFIGIFENIGDKPDDIAKLFTLKARLLTRFECWALRQFTQSIPEYEALMIQCKILNKLTVRLYYHYHNSF